MNGIYDNFVSLAEKKENKKEVLAFLQEYRDPELAKLKPHDRADLFKNLIGWVNSNIGEADNDILTFCMLLAFMVNRGPFDMADNPEFFEECNSSLQAIMDAPQAQVNLKDATRSTMASLLLHCISKPPNHKAKEIKDYEWRENIKNYFLTKIINVITSWEKKTLKKDDPIPETFKETRSALIDLFFTVTSLPKEEFDEIVDSLTSTLVSKEEYAPKDIYFYLNQSAPVRDSIYLFDIDRFKSS